jgi:undecaprenyl-diphosphatase
VTEERNKGRPSLATAIAAAVLAIIWFEMLSLGTGGLDDNILRTIYAGGHPALVGVAKGFTFLGTWQFGIAAVVAGIALLVVIGRRRAALAAALVIALGRLLVEIQKYAIARLRPADEVHLVPVSTPSFPSGHAANSTIVCLTFAILFFANTRWKRPAIAVALLLAFCIGLSRVMLGVHWPTDVIGGWSFGLLWVVLTLPWAERLAHNGRMR